jgi:hypothetical protein
MRRKTFDALATIAGLVLAVVLAVAGGLMLWGHNFVDSQVRTQLAAQKIVFPAAGSPQLKALPTADRTAMLAYAGQQLVTGQQAEVWADHYIAVHLREIAGGKTYAELSGAYQQMTPAQQASPAGQALNTKVQIVFRGETLRGLLLNAYAFGEMSYILFIASIVSFAAAALLLILSGLGVAHLRRTPEEAELFSRNKTTAARPATAH